MSYRVARKLSIARFTGGENVSGFMRLSNMPLEEDHAALQPRC
jgi:hypothetical protein